MVGSRHALTLRTKNQGSNPNPKPWVRVLTFALGMGRDAEQRMSILLHISLDTKASFLLLSGCFLTRNLPVILLLSEQK